MTDLIETDAAFDDRMAALEAEADAAELVAGTEYVLEITAASSGRDGFSRIPFVARYHQ